MGVFCWTGAIGGDGGSAPLFALTLISAPGGFCISRSDSGSKGITATGMPAATPRRVRFCRSSDHCLNPLGRFAETLDGFGDLRLRCPSTAPPGPNGISDECCFNPTLELA